jgi:hypothetical protein
MSDDHLEDYIIFLTLTVICSWVVQLVVGEYLFSQRRNLLHKGFLITKSISSDGMAAVLELANLQGVYISRNLQFFLDVQICGNHLILVF